MEGVVLGAAGLAVGRLGLAAVHARIRTLELRLVSDGQMQSRIEDAESKSTIFHMFSEAHDQSRFHMSFETAMRMARMQSRI